MSSLISNVLLGVGKQVWNALSEDRVSPQQNRVDQLQQFGDRLDYAINPEKASFKQLLSDNFIHSLDGVEFLSEKMKDGLMSDPQLAQFVSRNGGTDGDYSIEKQGSHYMLSASNGQEWVVPANSELESKVDALCRLESIKQLAAVQPGLDLGHLVDLAFQESGKTTTVI